MRPTTKVVVTPQPASSSEGHPTLPECRWRAVILMKCPSYESEQIIKNGSIQNDKWKYVGKACGRQFVETPQHQMISDETKGLINKLLLEKPPLSFCPDNIVRWKKAVIRPTISLSTSTLPYGNESPDECARHYPSPRSWTIILTRFGILLTMTVLFSYLTIIPPLL